MSRYVQLLKGGQIAEFSGDRCQAVVGQVSAAKIEKSSVSAYG